MYVHSLFILRFSFLISFFFFFFNDTATTEIYTLSLHDALPISAHLVGRHVADRADDDSRERVAGAGDFLVRTGLGGRLREAEVEDLHEAVAGHEDVFRLQIAMDDAAAVGGGQTGGELERELGGARQA